MVSVYTFISLQSQRLPRKSTPWSQVPGTQFLESILQRLETLVQLYVKVMVPTTRVQPYLLSPTGHLCIQKIHHVCVS
jgi:hypothetical protein